METHRQKYYKHKIKNITVNNNSTDEALDEIDKEEQNSFQKYKMKRQLSVTLLGSPSYHNQNQAFIVNSDHFMQNSILQNNTEDDLCTESIAEENMAVKNQYYCNEPNNVEQDVHGSDSDKIFNTVTIELVDEETANQVSELIDENRTDSGENLQPTITDLIPEKEMDILRKSLEDDKEEDVNIIHKSDILKNKKSKRNLIKKCYVDFVSEDEDFVWDSTSWKDTDGTSSEEGEPRRKKKFNCDMEKVGTLGLKKKRINKRKARKDAKSKGKQYINKSGTSVKEKQLQTNPCLNKNCPYKCGEVQEEKRVKIFEYFWQLSNQRKKDWLIAMSSCSDVKRKRSKESSYRTNTFNYFINDGEGRRQVCLKFLLNTLNVTQRFVYYTISNQTQGLSKTDNRGKCVPANKTPNEVKEGAIKFIQSLPALPSHYCRKDSTKLYLPTEYKNIKNLYRVYKEERVSKGVDCLSEKVFRQIFNNEFNIGFHVPKKDKCLKCIKLQGQNPDDCLELKAHLEEKEASKRRLECHRELGKEHPSILCTSFDLQKVLNTPHGDSMLLFYSRKYAMYNLCFYESVTRKGFCYVWGETNGKRGANEISTILQKYINNVDSRGNIKKMILYSDSCPGQNKNKIVLAAIHNALLQSENLEAIQMNYLLPGHTEMTVDSIHSTIEQSIRHNIVWAPSQWTTVCQLARKEPEPYHVESLVHDDFQNYEDLANKYFKGNLTGKISKIRIATFKKSSPNYVKIKFTMKEETQDEKIMIHSKPKLINPKYNCSLPITKAKFNDLKKLCDTGVIPKIFKAEYLNLPTHSGTDELAETDVEDETEE